MDVEEIKKEIHNSVSSAIKECNLRNNSVGYAIAQDIAQNIWDEKYNYQSQEQAKRDELYALFDTIDALFSL